jgi:hypothetical protein
MIHAVKLPTWGLGLEDASYYGYRFGLIVGPWLVFLGKAKDQEAKG